MVYFERNGAYSDFRMQWIRSRIGWYSENLSNYFWFNWMVTFGFIAIQWRDFCQGRNINVSYHIGITYLSMACNCYHLYFGHLALWQKRFNASTKWTRAGILKGVFRCAETCLEIPHLGLIIQNTTCFVLMVISGTLLSKNVNKFNMGSVSSKHTY